jgi:hypothetical protein
MAACTAELRTALARITRAIAEIAAKPRSELRHWQQALRDLETERVRLQRIVLERRVEGRKKVVDFRRWRDGPRSG